MQYKSDAQIVFSSNAVLLEYTGIEMDVRVQKMGIELCSWRRGNGEEKGEKMGWYVLSLCDRSLLHVLN